MFHLFSRVYRSSCMETEKKLSTAYFGPAVRLISNPEQLCNKSCIVETAETMTI